jgi:predicted MFS family arabinose efflux permease
LVSLFAGVWVDRLRRKPILMAADIGRAVILITIPLAAWIGTLSMAQLYVVAVLVGVLTVLYHVADQSFLPAIVARQNLVEANARISASDSLAEIAGPSLAGTLVQWMSAPLAILADISTYLFSAASLALIRTPEPPPTPQASPNMWREIQEGLHSTLRQPILRALMGVTATHRFFGNFIGTIYWLFLVRELGFSPAMVGISIGVGGIGALIGALVAGSITRRLGMGRTLIACIIIVTLWNGPLLLPIYEWPRSVVFGLILTMQLMGDIFWSVFFINVASLRQAVIPSALLGRVSASLDFVGEGASPIGALVAGGIATVIGMRATWLLGAAGILLGALWLIFSPIRHITALPENPEM